MLVQTGGLPCRVWFQSREGCKAVTSRPRLRGCRWTRVWVLWLWPALQDEHAAVSPTPDPCCKDGSLLLPHLHCELHVVLKGEVGE